MARQLELEKATLLEKKRREQDERRRKQEELDQILLENRRKARAPHLTLLILFPESGQWFNCWM